MGGARSGWVWAACAVLAGCGSYERVVPAESALRLEAEELDFGAVRVGRRAEGALTVRNGGTARLTLSAALEDDPERPGGAAAFALEEVPEAIPASAALRVSFLPDAVGEFAARLVLTGDDPDPATARQTVRLVGRGGVPRMRVEVACAPPCAGFAAANDPPAIDFGLRPPMREGTAGLFGEPDWPTLKVSNEGELPLTLLGAEFRGDPAFRARESVEAAGLVLAAGEAREVHLVFDPPGPQVSYAGALVIAGDDPALPEARIALRGELAPNQPPRVCAAVVEAVGADGVVRLPRDAAGAPEFGAPVAVQPGGRAQVLLSAFSDHFEPGAHPREAWEGDPSRCTTDVEDRRAVLRYHWAVVERPAGSAAEPLDAASPETLFRPDAIGRYALRLTATDPQGASGSAEVSFEASPLRDLVAQLSWTGQAGVDLDVHLVRPGPCGAEASCLFRREGDVNGFSSVAAEGLFDWGEPGQSFDDPRLDLDDQGEGALLENVNLNYPENDPACLSSPCAYDVYVHFFKDGRDLAAAPPCPARPCAAGTGCGCAGGAVCVSERCVAPVRPSLALFVRPPAQGALPALTLPAAGEALELPGPCVLWHAARIVWPSREELARDHEAPVTVLEIGAPGARELAFYGSLAAKSFSCAPNTPAGTAAADVTFLPGEVPFYP